MSVHDAPAFSARPGVQRRAGANGAPLLSIIIPAYNAAATLPRTLASLERILPAHRAAVEPVLVDDGSVDGTPAILEAFFGKGVLPATTWVRQDNAGSSAARNAGLERSRGQWIMFLDADDELAIDPLSLLTPSDGATAHCFAVEYHKAGRRRYTLPALRMRGRSHLDLFTAANPVQSSCVIFRRACLQASFDPALRYLEDWAFWLANPELFERPITHRGVVSAVVHVHGGNKSCNYRQVGWHRQLIAEQTLERLASQLTRRQRNNLLIQAAIGRVLQGQGVEWAALCRLPCSARLYGKLLVYATLRQRWARVDLFGGSG